MASISSPTNPPAHQPTTPVSPLLSRHCSLINHHSTHRPPSRCKPLRLGHCDAATLRHCDTALLPQPSRAPLPLPPRPQPTPSRSSKRTGTTRERTGCVTCRRRKKKCDGGYPCCNNCRRLNFDCVREDPRQPAGPRDAGSHPPAPVGETTILPTSSSTVLTVPASTWTAPTLSLDPVASWPGAAGGTDAAINRRSLLRYYMQTVSTLLTSTLENNCFVSVFLPMATESPMLLNAIIAHSSSHLALRDKSYEVLALQSRCNALSSLSSSLSSQERDPELDLSCSLVLCSMESIVGDTGISWYQHLLGASQVIRSSSAFPHSGQLTAADLGRFLSTFEGRWLLRNHAYHDVMHTITMGARPLIQGYYWHSPEEKDLVDSYFGLASRLIYLISEISVLNADMADSASLAERKPHDPGSPSVSRSDFSQRAFMLETQLLEWECRDSQDKHLMAMAESYRAGALIHLYRVIRRHLPDLTATLARKISGPVKTIIESVEQMPMRCLPECTLLFPLFLAGGETESQEYIRIIRQRMLDIVNYRHFHNVEVALAVLDELWRLRGGSPTGSPRRVDWTDVLQRRNWKLALT
ncbi:hypothetical protein K490DRAFT_37955 [Saccharata proteae CBS 121410]|uniref:Zn(2)-C6 fungal-type domain-containing protein n=1 Tax=Saccharata proteae CBS 121410 TaxID=1314787 RepID=A0A6A5YDV5_9PEZI|nr:hypothetical protein K490DRAFT_37955 [Saccharata proteae CBS 121410]